MISDKEADNPSYQTAKITNMSVHFCRRRKINRRLIMNNNCKETVLCYNLSDIIIVDDNFRYSMTSISVRNSWCNLCKIDVNNLLNQNDGRFDSRNDKAVNLAI